VPLLEVAKDATSPNPTPFSGMSPIGTSLAPESRIERAEALQWMFFEQHALEPNIGAAYFWLSLVKGGRDLQTHALEDWMERGYARAAGDGKSPQDPRLFAAGQLTVADIALYGYTHVADRCDYDLCDLPGDPRLAHGRACAGPDFHRHRRLWHPADALAPPSAIGLPIPHHLWNTKNAPAAINTKPKPWLQVRGSLR
jgi:glutathione S-transferase